MKVTLRTAFFVIIFTFGIVSVTNAALISRLGGLAYYDTTLDITWSANPTLTGIGAWDQQITSVSNLNIGGITGWRVASGGTYGVDEYLSLYQNDGITAATPGVFGSLPSLNFFWTGMEFAQDTSKAFAFSFSTPLDFDVFNKNFSRHAWAVHDGDVGTVTVPAPGTIALMGLGLAGLLSLSRRHRVH